MKNKDYCLIWPSYLEANNSRREGRRVSLKLAVEKVKLEEIANSASLLGYKAEIIKEKAYPRSWWIKGYVLVYPKKESKNLLLKKLALKIKEERKKR